MGRGLAIAAELAPGLETSPRSTSRRRCCPTPRADIPLPCRASPRCCDAVRPEYSACRSRWNLVATARPRSRRLRIPLSAWRAIAAVFGQTIHHEFVNIDNTLFIQQNPLVVHGLTRRSVAQAFREPHAANWIPLTWISHMIDWDLYGDNAGGHHLTNVLLHAATTVLLFLALWRMTGDHLAQRAGDGDFRHPSLAGRVGRLGQRTERTCSAGCSSR